MKIKLNLGCGNVRPANWINMDSSLNSVLQRNFLGNFIAKLLKLNIYSKGSKYINLNKKWKFADRSVDVIYASHVFEHIYLKGIKRFLSESYRTLKPGGVIRLVVPDLYENAKLYIKEFEEENINALHTFLHTLNLHMEGQYPFNRKIHRLLGWFQGWPHQHKYMYDQPTLSKLLEAYGFKKIKMSRYGKSNYIPEIIEVESKSHETYACSIYLEALKPVKT